MRRLVLLLIFLTTLALAKAHARPARTRCAIDPYFVA